MKKKTKENRGGGGVIFKNSQQKKRGGVLLVRYFYIKMEFVYEKLKILFLIIEKQLKKFKLNFCQKSAALSEESSHFLKVETFRVRIRVFI